MHLPLLTKQLQLWRPLWGQLILPVVDVSLPSSVCSNKPSLLKAFDPEDKLTSLSFAVRLWSRTTATVWRANSWHSSTTSASRLASSWLSASKKRKCCSLSSRSWKVLSSFNPAESRIARALIRSPFQLAADVSAMRGGGKDIKARKTRLGMCYPNTMIVFDKAEGSSLNLVGKSKG